MRETSSNAAESRGKRRKRAVARVAAAKATGVFAGLDHKPSKFRTEPDEQDYTGFERNIAAIQPVSKLGEYDHKILSNGPGPRDGADK